MKNLTGKHAVVFGAGGSICAAVAKEFAAEGAEVYLSGRTKANVEAIVEDIAKNGGSAHGAQVDAEDDSAVGTYIDKIETQAGSIDIVFNAIGPRVDDYGTGKNVVDLTVAEFMIPVSTILKSQFITSRVAARYMVKQHSGVILFITGSPARGHVEGATAIGSAFGAIETFMENLAVEVSPCGVRVLCLRTTANSDSRTIQQTVDALASRMNVTPEQVNTRIASLNLLKVPASVLDTAKTLAFLASDRARMMTGTVVNSSAGAAAD
jgi:NAD(P)-dependent dehydrogenase (short-subunit alcohol dehydrogenase family)